MPELKERQIRLVHELMYQIRVEEAMTRNVVHFAPSSTFREIQRCMKERRFSGTPIVDDRRVVGMISIDDIITAFDRGHIDEPVGNYMTSEVVTIPRGYSVIAASNLFNKYRFGRLPVVEGADSPVLVGILTFGDILSHLLVKMNTIAERVEAREQSLTHAMRNAKDRLHFDLPADNFDLAGMASTSIKKHLESIGVAPPVVRRIAVICYEAEMNVIIHSLGGYMDLFVLEDRVRVEVTDVGPGIPDISRALTAGYTTANEKIRALGFGAGMGLVNIKRCADEFDIRSSISVGTVLEAVVSLTPPSAAAAFPEAGETT